MKKGKRRGEVEPIRRRLQSRRGPVARPLVVLGTLHHLRAHRVEHRIAQHLGEVSLLLDEESLEPPLEQMSASCARD